MRSPTQRLLDELHDAIADDLAQAILSKLKEIGAAVDEDSITAIEEATSEMFDITVRARPRR